MNNIIKRKWNKNAMVNIEDLRGMAFQAESGGHTFQISGIDGDGNPVALSGTPSGVMLRSDNQDVALTCSISDGKVNATLPANAYSVPGRFGITIFLTSDGQKTAIYAAVGTVGKTSSGTVAPPAGSDVVDLVNAIAAAVATIPASYTDLMAAMAPTYSSSGLYAVGSYAWYNGKLYRCTTAITSGETWTSGHWTLANLGSDLVDLKSANNQLIGHYDHFDSSYFGRGARNYSTYPTNPSITWRVSSKVQFTFPVDITLSTATGIVFYIYFNGSYNGPITSKKITAGTTFALEIQRSDPDTSEVADIDEFVNSLFVESYMSNLAKDVKEKDVPIKQLGGVALDGKALLDSSLFGRGTWSSNAYNPSGAQNRVSTLNFIKYPYDITIKPESDFRMYVFIKGGSSYGWLNTEKKIDANTAFALEIKRATDVSGETADIDEFVGSIKVSSVIVDSLDITEYNSAIINKGEDAFDVNLFGRGGWSGGAYNPAGPQFRIATIRQISFPYDIIVSAKTGFNFYIFFTSSSPYGWKTSYTVPANTPFALEFQRVNYDSSETANVATFVSNLTKRSPYLAPIEDSIFRNKGQKIVFLGDSTIGLERGATSVPNIVSKLIGAICYNFAIGGTRVLIPSQHSSNGWKYYDFKELASAIATDTYTNQDAHKSDTGMPDYLPTLVSELSAMDFSTVDIICVNYGANDYNDGAILSDFISQYKESIEQIWTAYNNLRFLIISPSWYFWYENGEYSTDCDTKTFSPGNKTLPQFIEGIKEGINKPLHLPFSDVYYDMSVGKYNIPLWFIENDHAHPNENGRNMLAKIIAKSLSGM